MSKVRVASFSMSLDGYGAGPDQSLENPLGIGGKDLHGWFVGTRAWQRMHGQEGGAGGKTSLPGSAWNVRLHQLGQLRQRFLPAEVARFQRDGLRDAGLGDGKLGATAHGLELDGHLEHAG